MTTETKADVRAGQVREGMGDRATIEEACAQRGWFFVRWPKGHLSRMGRREILHRLPVLVQDAPGPTAEPVRVDAKGYAVARTPEMPERPTLVMDGVRATEDGQIVPTRRTKGMGVGGMDSVIAKEEKRWPDESSQLDEAKALLAETSRRLASVEAVVVRMESSSNRAVRSWGETLRKALEGKS